MIIAAADIGASNVGLCTNDGTAFRASSWHPKEAASGTDIDYEAEARRLSEWRIYWHSFLIGEKVERLAVEQPLRSDMRKRIPGAGLLANDVGPTDAAATSMKTVWRVYNMTGAALEIAVRLNIPVTMLSGARWRLNFIGVSRAPKGTKNGRAWLKKRAREEAARIGVEVRNDDQADAVGICWAFKGILKIDGMGTRPGDLLSVLSQ